MSAAAANSEAADAVNGEMDEQKLLAKQKKDARDAKKQAKLEKFQQKQAAAAAQPATEVRIFRSFFCGV